MYGNFSLLSYNTDVTADDIVIDSPFILYKGEAVLRTIVNPSDGKIEMRMTCSKCIDFMGIALTAAEMITGERAYCWRPFIDCKVDVFLLTEFKTVSDIVIEDDAILFKGGDTLLGVGVIDAFGAMDLIERCGSGEVRNDQCYYYRHYIKVLCVQNSTLAVAHSIHRNLYSRNDERPHRDLGQLTHAHRVKCGDFHTNNRVIDVYKYNSVATEGKWYSFIDMETGEELVGLYIAGYIWVLGVHVPEEVPDNLLKVKCETLVDLLHDISHMYCQAYRISISPKDNKTVLSGSIPIGTVENGRLSVFDCPAVKTMHSLLLCYVEIVEMVK